jgi:hypothetical protein
VAELGTSSIGATNRDQGITADPVAITLDPPLIPQVVSAKTECHPGK